MVLFRRRHRDGQVFAVGHVTQRMASKVELERYDEGIDSARIERAMDVARDSARRAGDEQALANGRIVWDESDRDAADQMYQDTFYELVPQALFRGKFHATLISPRSTAGEFLRTAKKLHLFHGYVPSEEPREEMLQRLGLRHVSGSKEARHIGEEE